MSSRNPIISRVYKNINDNSFDNDGSGVVTRKSVINSTFILLAIVVATVSLVAYFSQDYPGIAGLASMVGIVGILGMTAAMFFSSKLIEGSFIGGVSFSIFEGLMAGGFITILGGEDYKGTPGWVLVGQALVATVAVCVIVLISYYSGIVKINEKFTNITYILVGSMATFYLINLFISLVFGVNMLFLDGKLSYISIGIAVVAIIVATMSLFTDLETVEVAINEGVPERFKWSLATGIMMTMVWMYLEILRLLSLLSRK